jgi:MYXO-CTERM domain-containing protein
MLGIAIRDLIRAGVSVLLGIVTIRSLPVAALAITLASSSVHAQTTQQNLGKYHQLRERLLTEFTEVGGAPGQSQPADVRDDGEGFIKWADSTIRLGWYLGVLATEHHLYTNPAHFPGAAPTGPEATLDELYYALLALERLDQVADASFPPPCTSTPALNGFFIRDDVPDGFHTKFPPLHTTYSDFVDPVLTNKEMSQDQVYHLLLGLALVKRFVAGGVSVNGRELRPWAVQQARRIIEHVAKDNWVIKNPACDNRNVNRGPLASGTSHGTRRAIEFITDGEFVPEVQLAMQSIWEGMRAPNYPVYIDIDNLHMTNAIAAVGNGWGESTADDLALLGQAPDWPLYALLHRALHADAAIGWCRTAEQINARARFMLDELPDGADIASPKPAPVATHGFTRSNRFMRDKQTAYTGEPGSEGYRFNGLDYLLLHNLYAIATPATWQGGSGPGVPACAAPEPDAGANDAGSGGSGGPDASAANGGASDDGGCGCRTAREGSSSSAPWLALFVFAALLNRRRAAPRASRDRR